MADTHNSFFSQKAMDKMKSPDDLDKYLSITSPGLWAVLCAGAALIIGLLVWAVFGSVTSKVDTHGVKMGDRVICFISSEDKPHIEAGDPANVNGVLMTVGSVSELPLSQKEAKNTLKSDYLVDSLIKEKWSYMVYFTGDSSELAEGAILDINITAERVSPISLVLGGGR